MRGIRLFITHQLSDAAAELSTADHTERYVRADFSGKPQKRFLVKRLARKLVQPAKYRRRVRAAAAKTRAERYALVNADRRSAALSQKREKQLRRFIADIALVFGNGRVGAAYGYPAVGKLKRYYIGKVDALHHRFQQMITVRAFSRDIQKQIYLRVSQ